MYSSMLFSRYQIHLNISDRIGNEEIAGIMVQFEETENNAFWYYYYTEAERSNTLFVGK